MNRQDPLRAAHHSTEAEQQILGVVLTNNDRYHEISSLLKVEHFYDPVHADIWREASMRIEGDHLASPITLWEGLAHHEGLAQLGGSGYLAKLAGASIAAFAIKDTAKMVVRMAKRRMMSGRLRQMAEELDSGRSADETAADLELLAHEVGSESDEPRTMSFMKAQTRALQQMLDVKEGKEVSVPTGLPSLDELVSFNTKRYSILGGSTSMGKTALALQIAFTAARRGHGVGFVTLEMPEEDLANRINSAEAQVPYKTYDRPMSEAIFRQVVEAAKRLESLPFEVFSQRVRDVPAILSEGKKLNRKWVPNGQFQGFKLLVIDYIQLVEGKGPNSFERLSQVANDLKQIAKTLDVHILALAQIDRNIGKGEHYSAARPVLSSLRGSGDLENAPDNVLFIFRPEYYLTPPRCQVPTDPEKRADWEADFQEWKGKAEIISAKARMGEIGSVTVGCDLATNRFWDLDQQQGMDF